MLYAKTSKPKTESSSTATKDHGCIKGDLAIGAVSTATKQELHFTVNSFFDDWQSTEDGEVAWIGKMPRPKDDKAKLKVKVQHKLSGNIPFAATESLTFLKIYGVTRATLPIFYSFRKMATVRTLLHSMTT